MIKINKQMWKGLSHLFRLKSLRMKFILSFLVLSLLPLILLASLSYHAYLEILQQNVRSYSKEVLDRVERNIQIYLDDLDRMLELRNDYYILQFMKLSIVNDIEGNQKFTYRLLENLKTIKNYKDDLRDVSITTLKGVKVGCYGVLNVDLSQNDLFQALANRNMRDNTMVIYGPHEDWLGGNVFSVGRAIYGDYDNFLGFMSFDVELQLLARICRDIRLGKTGYVTLLIKNGRIIFHPQRFDRKIGRLLLKIPLESPGGPVIILTETGW